MPQSTHAAIQLIGTSTATGSSASFTASTSASAQNDLVVVIDSFANGTNGNPGVGTAGYAELNDLFISDTNSANFSVSYKVMGASPDATVSCNGSGSASLGASCVVYVWRGVDTTTPMDVASTSATLISSTAVNCPSITPTTAGAIVMCAGAVASGAAPTAVTWPTTPAGIGGGTSATSAQSSGAITTLVVYGAWSSGAYDPLNWTISAGTASQDSWAALTLALRPSIIAVPTVTSDSADVFLPTAASTFGSVTNIGGGAATTCGFAWGTVSTLSAGDTATTTGATCPASTGSFHQTLSTSLSTNTTYFYRAYADNGSKGYGTIKSFSTGNATPARKMRLFEGFKIKVIGNKVKLLQQ